MVSLMSYDTTMQRVLQVATSAAAERRQLRRAYLFRL